MYSDYGRGGSGSVLPYSSEGGSGSRERDHRDRDRRSDGGGSAGRSRYGPPLPSSALAVGGGAEVRSSTSGSAALSNNPGGYPANSYLGASSYYPVNGSEMAAAYRSYPPMDGASGVGGSGSTGPWPRSERGDYNRR